MPHVSDCTQARHSQGSNTAGYQFQWRHRVTRADGAHGPRHPRDDATLCQTRHADHPQCLPGGDGQGPRRTTAPTDRQQRRTADTRQGRLAARRDAQNPTRARLLRSPQSRRVCPYANICEQCDFFVPDPAATTTISAQLNDIRALQADAQARGWHDEAARHQRVAASLEQHLQRLRRNPPTDLPS